MSNPPLHPLPPSLILPHSVSHLVDAAPINSPPRTTAPTAPSFLSILPDSDKCNGSQFVQEEAPIDGSPNTPSKHKEIKAPTIGMKFDCDDSAYEFYKQYAHRMGFSVRKQYVRRGSAGDVKRRTFCCSREGERVIDRRREQVSFHHPISQIGCLAQMTCQLQKDGMLEVVSFHEQHNHEFAPSPMKHMLRSNRKITPAQQAFADDAEKSGVSIKQTIDLLSMQVGGYENLGFLNVDYKNHVNSKRRVALKRGDGRAVMDHFTKMQLEDPSYFYSIQLDDDNQILNIFWADSRSIVDYGHFGDVICFDTTYRTNSYGRPFAPFIGVNHHKQSIIFGAALLYDETITSFKWLFETFLSAMSGKQPKTIFTDQSAVMANAIEDVFPESNHRLYENEWIVAWNNMLETYNLTDNPWLREMFDVKEKWCMVYGRHMFTADMKSTQCSESMNSVLKKYLKPKHGLLQFFGHYSRVLSDKRSQELQAEFKMRQTTPVLLFDFEMLRHAAKLYTPEIFKMFQAEYVKIVDCTIYKASKSDSITEYRVKYRNKTQEHLVKYEASTTTVQCSCMKFSFLGILCSHALKVLDKKNVKRIPAHYVLKRWTQDAKVGSIKDYRGIDIKGSAQEFARNEN
ncbi:protein FAR1-RELATED SEQUENCE 5-like [Quercus suber]|uniref:protein FAR1-RELATED SEQUENCE 5-like n=1 Tax=Quercus suber TaxID=58331 RepID=UPI0032DEE94E